MARMHSRRRGKSKSEKPVFKKPPGWAAFSKEEVVELVVQLAKEGKTPSRIGLVLRDNYGIPSVKALTGSSITQILRDEKSLSEYPEDLMNLFQKAVKLHKHLEINKKDEHNRRVLHLVESKIRRLSSYYKQKGVLVKDWKYVPEQVALIIKAK